MQMFRAIDSNDLARYRELRALAMQMSGSMIKTIPRQAMTDIGKALGIERHGVLVFDSMDITSVMMDACLFDWFKDGKNLVEKYFEAHSATPGASESILQHAYTHARYRILLPEDFNRNGAVYSLDLLRNEHFTLMDFGLSQSLTRGIQGMIATRTLPLGNYWMTGGAALPVGTRGTGEAILKKIRDGRLLEDKTPEGSTSWRWPLPAPAWIPAPGTGSAIMLRDNRRAIRKNWKKGLRSLAEAFRRQLVTCLGTNLAPAAAERSSRGVADEYPDHGAISRSNCSQHVLQFGSYLVIGLTHASRR